MEYSTLKIENLDKIVVLTIARPNVLNALNSTVFAELDSALETISQSDARVLIITGEGSKSFVAGADIAEMSSKSKEDATLFSILGQKVFRRMETLPIPVIAAVNGFALGGGCELAMACDFRIAANNAKFGQPEVNLGLIPGYAGTQRLARLIGLGNALYLLTTADVISADEALRMGLVQKVVEPAELMNTCMEIASKIKSKGNHAIRKVKIATREGWLGDFEAGCTLEARMFGSLFAEKEALEGMNAFLEKRKPNWES